MTWRKQARCAPGPDTPQDVVDSIAEGFFPVNPTGRIVQAAKAVCAACPVRQECLNEALQRGYDHGIWGGFDAAERRAMRRARIRGAA